MTKQTHSNSDCSRHVLSDMRPGQLVQVKRSFIIYRNELPENDKCWIPAYCKLQEGTIMVLLEQSFLEPSRLTSLDYCYTWDFKFLHPTLMNVFYHWNINIPVVQDLDVILKPCPS